jgi:hypothetical protein
MYTVVVEPGYVAPGTQSPMGDFGILVRHPKVAPTMGSCPLSRRPPVIRLGRVEYADAGQACPALWVAQDGNIVERWRVSIRQRGIYRLTARRTAPLSSDPATDTETTLSLYRPGTDPVDYGTHQVCSATIWGSDVNGPTRKATRRCVLRKPGVYQIVASDGVDTIAYVLRPVRLRR